MLSYEDQKYLINLKEKIEKESNNFQELINICNSKLLEFNIYDYIYKNMIKKYDIEISIKVNPYFNIDLLNINPNIVFIDFNFITKINTSYMHYKNLLGRYILNAPLNKYRSEYSLKDLSIECVDYSIIKDYYSELNFFSYLNNNLNLNLIDDLQKFRDDYIINVYTKEFLELLLNVYNDYKKYIVQNKEVLKKVYLLKNQEEGRVIDQSDLIKDIL